MESTQQTSTTSGPETKVRQKIINAYRDHILEHGTEPASIYAFCKEIEIEEEQFYEHFNHFEQVSEAFWADLLEKVLNQMRDDENYTEQSVREKFLSFYYQFFSELKKHRSYFLLSFDDKMMGLGGSLKSLDGLRKDFRQWASDLVMQGVSSREISSRSRLTETYDRLFWYQFIFLMNFWRNDKSKGFEKTDAAIEKTVNLSFDLIEKNALDSALDFGKFIFQNR